MPKYISMLRGINVSGQKIMKMEDLRALYESLGFNAVTSYIQSGNVIFQSEILDTGVLSKTIEDKIKSYYGFQVPVVIRTHDELDKIINNNPYITKRDEDISKLSILFLKTPPPLKTFDELPETGPNNEEFIVAEKELYLFFPEFYGKSKWNNNFFEKKAGIAVTTRNWRTVLKLHELSK